MKRRTTKMKMKKRNLPGTFSWSILKRILILISSNDILFFKFPVLKGIRLRPKMIQILKTRAHSLKQSRREVNGHKLEKILR
jgi:hypothetical protein